VDNAGCVRAIIQCLTDDLVEPVGRQVSTLSPVHRSCCHFAASTEKDETSAIEGDRNFPDYSVETVLMADAPARVVRLVPPSRPG